MRKGVDRMIQNVEFMDHGLVQSIQIFGKILFCNLS